MKLRENRAFGFVMLLLVYLIAGASGKATRMLLPIKKRVR